MMFEEVDNKPFVENQLPLQILRTIAHTTTTISFNAAVKMGDLSLVWLTTCENVEIVDNDMFVHACKHGRTEIVRLLLDLPLERGVNPAANNNEVLCSACDEGCTDIVRLLLALSPERGVNPAANNYEPLRNACENGHTEIVRLLLDLERGMNPAAKSTLRWACYWGHTEIVRVLLDLPLEKGVDPTIYDNLALRHAWRFGHTEIVRLLLDLPLERGVNPGARDNEALRTASYNGKTKIVRMLLALSPERGVNPAALENASSPQPLMPLTSGVGLRQKDLLWFFTLLLLFSWTVWAPSLNLGIM